MLYGTTRQPLTEEHGKGFIFLFLDLQQVPGHSLSGGHLQADLPQPQQVKVRELLHSILIIISKFVSIMHLFLDHCNKHT
jgi:hypothetical protein